MSTNGEVIAAIVAFVRGIGIVVREGAVTEATLIPGIRVAAGELVYDRERLSWPGDLLHEAGHLAVTAPEHRATLAEIESDGGEEMATIAWSYAAARAIGLDPRIVFHEGGYRGGGGWLADVFADGGMIGVPLLQWFGMTLDAERAAAAGTAPFPAMQRWLR